MPPPTASVTPSPSGTAPTAPGPSVFRIAITATGYQRELDERQRVRMDLNAEAPIVGAHSRCGGSVCWRCDRAT
jgi:hypothetical protein